MSSAGYPGIGHDRRFSNLGIENGFIHVLLDYRCADADYQFVKEELEAATSAYYSGDYMTTGSAGLFGFGLGLAALTKTLAGLAKPNGLTEMIMWYLISDNFGKVNNRSSK